MLVEEPQVLWKVCSREEADAWQAAGALGNTQGDPFKAGFFLAGDSHHARHDQELLLRNREADLLRLDPDALPLGTRWLSEEVQEVVLRQCVGTTSGAPVYVRMLSDGAAHLHHREPLSWAVVGQRFALKLQPDGTHQFPGDCKQPEQLPGLGSPQSMHASDCVQVVCLGTGADVSRVYHGQACSSFALLVRGEAVLLANAGVGTVHAAVRELGLDNLPEVVFVSQDHTDTAGDLPTYLAVEGAEKSRRMRVVALPYVMTRLKRHRMLERRAGLSLGACSEWLEVADGHELRLRAGAMKQHEVLIQPLSGIAHSDHSCGVRFVVGGVGISWLPTSTFDITLCERLASQSQLLIITAEEGEEAKSAQEQQGSSASSCADQRSPRFDTELPVRSTSAPAVAVERASSNLTVDRTSHQSAGAQPLTPSRCHTPDGMVRVTTFSNVMRFVQSSSPFASLLPDASAGAPEQSEAWSRRWHFLQDGAGCEEAPLSDSPTDVLRARRRLRLDMAEKERQSSMLASIAHALDSALAASSQQDGRHFDNDAKPFKEIPLSPSTLARGAAAALSAKPPQRLGRRLSDSFGGMESKSVDKLQLAAAAVLERSGTAPTALLTQLRLALCRAPNRRSPRDVVAIQAASFRLKEQLAEMQTAMATNTAILESLEPKGAQPGDPLPSFCSVVVTGYGSPADEPGSSWGIPSSAVLRPGRRLWLKAKAAPGAPDAESVGSPVGHVDGQSTSPASLKEVPSLAALPPGGSPAPLASGEDGDGTGTRTLLVGSRMAIRITPPPPLSLGD